MTVICANCQTPNDESHRFCSNCGAPLAAPQPTAASQPPVAPQQPAAPEPPAAPAYVAPPAPQPPVAPPAPPGVLYTYPSPRDRG
jgi:hypothetical protein